MMSKYCLATFNIQSIKTKLPSINAFLHSPLFSHTPLIAFAITETKRKHSDLPLLFPGFIVAEDIVTDARAQGGIVTLCAVGHGHHEYVFPPTLPKPKNFVCTQLFVESIPFVIVSHYRQPIDEPEHHESWKNFSKIIDHLLISDENIFVIGDFNPGRQQQKSFRKWQQHGLADLTVQYGVSWTLKTAGTTPDRIFTNRPDIIVKCYALNTGVTASLSDHIPLVCEFILDSQHVQSAAKFRLNLAPSSLEKWKSVSVPFSRFVLHHQIPSAQLFSEQIQLRERYINAIWHELQQLIWHTAIKIFGFHKKHRRKQPQWSLDPDFRKALKLFNQHLFPDTQHSIFKQQLQAAIATARAKQWRLYVHKNMSTHTINWSIYRSLVLEQHSDVSSVRDVAGHFPVSQQESLNNLSLFFEEQNKVVPIPSVVAEVSADVVPICEKVFAFDKISVDMVAAVCAKLPLHKACGPDNLPYELFRYAHADLIACLTWFFNCCFGAGCLPFSFKLSDVLAKWKQKGSKENASSFRPISLTSTVCKIMEAVVLQNFIEPLLSPLLSTRQYGFRKKRSCKDQIFRLFHFITYAISHDQLLPVVFLDIKKAFDHVDHHILLRKFMSLCPDQQLVAYVHHFLLYRSFRVISDNCGSSWRNMQGGVPQGSVISPMLFLVFIDDVARASCSQLSESGLFADDIAMWPCLNSAPAQSAVCVQEALAAIETQAQHDGIIFSSDKSNVVVFGKNHRLDALQPDLSPFENLRLQNFVLQRVAEYKYLGVILDEHLQFKSHIKLMIQRLQSKSNLLCRTVFHPNMVHNVVKACLCSIVAYAAPFIHFTERQAKQMINAFVKPIVQSLHIPRSTSRANLLLEFQINSPSMITDVEAIRLHNRLIDPDNTTSASVLYKHECATARSRLTKSSMNLTDKVINAFAHLHLSLDRLSDPVPRKSLIELVHQRRFALWDDDELCITHPSVLRNFRQQSTSQVPLMLPHYLSFELRPALFVAQLRFSFVASDSYPPCSFCDVAGKLSNPFHLFCECVGLASYFRDARRYCSRLCPRVAVYGIVCAVHKYYAGVLKGIEFLLQHLPADHALVKYLPQYTCLD